MKPICQFPFVAIVGQENVKEALLIALINPKAGGLLISGEKGTAKSLLVRSITDFLTDGALINLPLNASEDMIFGHIDVEQAVLQGEKFFSPGILARAQNRILYVDEINLLRRELLIGLLDAKDRGVNLVEREGLSYSHIAEFTLLGTMNPEEGSLTSNLLDRFGLFTAVNSEVEVVARCEIVQRYLAYETDPLGFCESFAEETALLRKKLINAKALLPHVAVSTAMMELAAQYGAKANTAGHRAEIFLLETARAIAALADRTYLLPGDIEKAAYFVLPHRMREQQNESEIPDQGKSSEADCEQEPTDRQRESQESEAEDEQEEDAASDSDAGEAAGENDPEPLESEEKNETDPESGSADEKKSDDAVTEQVAAIDKNFSQVKISLDMMQDRHVRNGNGKRSLTRTDLKQGRYVFSCIPKGKVTDLAFDATLRAAAPYQKMRARGQCQIRIEQEDLRQKVREKRIGNTFLFVVDASGSMGARERMKAVKGAIYSMLQDAYQKRDQVGMIAFRRKTADVLLPVTRSIELAQKCLQTLPTGGATPLAEGLGKALAVLQSMQKREKAMQPILVLVTDGRTNRSSQDSGDPVAEALAVARKISQTKVQSVVIDTESDFVRMGLAKAVAKEMGAAYSKLQDLSQQGILHIVQDMHSAL
ncbi:MAG: VWA domain-containing protein [Sporomusaceae bacterium]|nr:VWA domain-containing protein [Sporomusaceae bacterium]